MNQGLAKGSNIPVVGPVQISWHAGQSTSSAPTQKNSPTPAEQPSTEPPETRAMSPAHEDSHMPEEEVIAGGWGGDDADDDFGML